MTSSSDSPVPDDLVDLAVRLADAAAPITLGYFRTHLAIDAKADDSPVTIADRQAEKAMRTLIESAHPEHGIYGEEHGQERLDSRFVWVLDPIDGTKAFVTGKPLFGTLIALLRDGVPVLGVIDMPALKERWIGVKGRPTTFNGEAVTSRSCQGLGDAWLYATSPQMFTGDDFTAFERLRQQTRAGLYGTDCYAYGLVASGFVDLVVEASMEPYDYCAVIPVIEGAGGIVSDWQGNPLSLNSDGRIVAAGDERVHAATIAALAPISP